jgi:putative tryptophan/tyrosine transport system substrate-binding protein
LQALRDAARNHGVLLIYPAATLQDIEAAIEKARIAGAAGLNVLASTVLNAYHKVIIKRCITGRLPAIYQWPERAREGGLIAYGPSFAEVYRQFARQLVKLLRGANPAELPVEQPATFELVVNLKTAKAVGLTIPRSVLARADEVVE